MTLEQAIAASRHLTEMDGLENNANVADYYRSVLMYLMELKVLLDAAERRNNARTS